MSLNPYVFWTGVHKHCDMRINGSLLTLHTCWGRPLTPAGEGWVRTDRARFLPTTAQTTRWATANCHSTTTASVLFPTSSSWSITIVHVPKIREVSHTWYLLLSGMSLSLDLSGGIGSLCLLFKQKVCSKPKWMEYNTVLKHWGVIPSQFWPSLPQIP